MTSSIFPWTRFWCPQGSNFHLSDAGFLADPETDSGRLSNNSLVPFDSIRDTPCLVLLGEPGIGKSSIIQQASSPAERLRNDYIFVNLGEYGDEWLLVDAIFRHPAFLNFLATEKPLELFLDSLDECQLQIAHVCKVLRRELKNHSVHLRRLKLRITCRTADWPKSFEDALRELFKEKLSIYQATPLRQVDVQVAAQSLVDPEAFMSELFRLQAQPLAIKPITLMFLLSVFTREGKLPASQTELYEHGCSVLVAESNQERIDAGQQGTLSTTQRLEVASRIAATMVFCNRSAVNLRYKYDLETQQLLSIQDLVGGNELCEAGEFLVDSSAIKEVVGTALFHGRGTGLVGFAHQTYLEFLAARYLSRRNIKLNQKLNLLQESEFGRGRVYPQLAEVAVWLTAFDRGIFDAILRDDPKILLKSDVQILTPEVRYALTVRLLELYSEESINEDLREDHQFYPKLVHSGLTEQLRTVIEAKQASESARLFAIHVANVNSLSLLAESLASLSLDTTETPRLRYASVYAVIEIGDDSTHKRLKPLALARARTEFDYSIKGRILNCLWPQLISASELFRSVDLPHEDASGSYRGFLQFELIKGLSLADLPHAFQWASTVESSKYDHSTRALIRQIAHLGWNHFEDTTIQPAYLQFAMAQVRNHASVLGECEPDASEEQLADNQLHRRQIVEYILREMPDFHSHATGLIIWRPTMVRSDDMSWLIERLFAEHSEELRERWITLIKCLFNQNSQTHLQSVLEACEQSPSLRECFQHRFGAIELSSDRAIELRRQFAEQAEWDREEVRRQNPPLIDPPPKQRVLNCLEKIELGASANWPELVMNLALDSESTHCIHYHGQDITILDGWIEADENTRTRIVNAAHAFLLDPNKGVGSDWLASDRTPELAFYVYQALALLYDRSTEVFQLLDTDAWERCAPCVVTLQDFPGVQGKATAKSIALRCFAMATATCGQCIRQVIDGVNENPDRLLILSFVDIAWCQELEEILVSYLANENVRTPIFKSILKKCIVHQSTEARRIAVQLLTLPLDSGVNARARERAIVAGTTLLEHAEDAGWEVVWPAIESDPEFGKSVIEGVSETSRMNPVIVSRIPESDAGKLYVWIANQYGFAKSRDEEQRNESPTHGVLDYRDSILRAIEYRGTRQAVESLQVISCRFPDHVWIKRVLNSASEIAMRNLWRALEPGQFLELTNFQDRYLVQNATHLQDLIMESLERLQQRLLGENPAVEDLWNADEPKDENYLSDYVVRHLRDDLSSRGIVSLREVEICRGSDGVPGERTDIYVNGVVVSGVHAELENVRVIVEVKCIWHRELETAMKTQLVDTYLKNNDCRRGIYLVGWYSGQRWNKSKNSFKRSRPKLNTLDKSLFQKQAESYSKLESSMRITAFVLECSHG